MPRDRRQAAQLRGYAKPLTRCGLASAASAAGCPYWLVAVRLSPEKDLTTRILPTMLRLKASRSSAGIQYSTCSLPPT